MRRQNRWLLALLCTALLGNSFLGALERVEAAPQVEKSPAQVLVSVNKATAEELETVKGIGPMLAQRIVEFREAHGRFEKVEDLIGVPGIGQAKLEKIRNQLTL